MLQDSNALATRPYRLTDWGVDFRRPLTEGEFEALGRLLSRVSNCTRWAIGDWLLAAENIYDNGYRYQVAMSLTGLTLHRLSECVRVAGSFRLEQRHLAPWAYYRLALVLPDRARMQALACAAQHGWSLARFTEYVRQQQLAEPGAPAPARPLVTCPSCGSCFPLQGHTRHVARQPDDAEKTGMDAGPK